ncbi:MAG: hypothetical protein MSQ05_10235 [Akkermansia sp.]|nr:hypothetical protein [Akkermansia sp.]
MQAPFSVFLSPSTLEAVTTPFPLTFRLPLAPPRATMTPDLTMDYENFLKRLELFASKNPQVLQMTLRNIFSMREIGNKTHGDMAEIAVSEFINQYMYDFSSEHVGKELFRSKTHEEDILITDDVNQTTFPVSLKAYGVGPVQLSTDKERKLFPRIRQFGNCITGADLSVLLEDSCFTGLRQLRILLLIYNERKHLCNLELFDINAALHDTAVVQFIGRDKRREYPIYRFEDKEGNYICEVRYGDQGSNALQRGFWTHTIKAASYFRKLFAQDVKYDLNQTLLLLLRRMLVASEQGHKAALKEIEADIERLKNIPPTK